MAGRGSPARRWGAVLGLALAALATACGEEPVERREPVEASPPPWPKRPPPAPSPALLAALDAGLAPLSTVPVPVPPAEIRDPRAAIRLGKALFWDQAMGSDGQTACATCHFAAGADDRRENVVHPGPNGVFETDGVTGPGQTLSSLPRIRSDDRIGSAGVPSAVYVAASSSGADQCGPLPDPNFGEGRQVTERNTPSVIGAALQREQFWDGRASADFNGHDGFGFTGNAAGAVGEPVAEASLASQALGPTLNPAEMSCAGRPWNGANGVAARLLDRPALAGQRVSRSDSVLGRLSAAPGDGLRCHGRTCTYRDLIETAFGPEAATGALETFSRLAGLAIAAYEATLIPDDTPFDRWLAGDPDALTEEQQLGVEVFVGKGKCVKCHAGPELTDASNTFYARQGPFGEFGNDVGFHNIGVRPTEEDLGRADTGPGGVSYSVSGAPADRGAFKTPGLRNVALTPPYFHNGGMPTLQAVMSFYDRGGDFENPERSPHIDMLGLPAKEFQAVVELMEKGFTDCRVERRRAPFDHPSLAIPGGPDLEAVGAEGLGPCP